MRRGTFTLAGHGLERFVACVTAMLRARVLWSCACDKIGDWACSTQDEVSRECVEQIADEVDPERSNVEIFEAGELTFLISDKNLAGWVFQARQVRPRRRR